MTDDTTTQAVDIVLAGIRHDFDQLHAQATQAGAPVQLGFRIYVGTDGESVELSAGISTDGDTLHAVVTDSNGQQLTAETITADLPAPTVIPDQTATPDTAA